MATAPSRARVREHARGGTEARRLVRRGQAAFVEQQFAAQDAYYREHYPGATFDVVVCDGEDAGRLYVDRWDREIRIMDIAVLPEFQRRGIGSRLLGSLIEEEGGGKPLTIHVERMNPALTWYERLGFRQLEDRGVYLLMASWQLAIR